MMIVGMVINFPVTTTITLVTAVLTKYVYAVMFIVLEENNNTIQRGNSGSTLE